ncbi:hypothetical protein QA633_39920 [Bradyrhizobium barranii]|uniref:hypothetical protein n=1 Tax=Bradyrhizobium barranii TaxID=2992140 RepID=UPI0024AF0C24|nr:hypothetical protein [Bradyrhizobium barranii]WFT94365.1 hypothetical protein QA633_39920 [Bradyrhizobium barranii]
MLWIYDAELAVPAAEPNADRGQHKCHGRRWPDLHSHSDALRRRQQQAPQKRHFFKALLREKATASEVREGLQQGKGLRKGELSLHDNSERGRLGSVRFF